MVDYFEIILTVCWLVGLLVGVTVGLASWLVGWFAFSSLEPIVSFSRRRLITRHDGHWRHTEFEFFHCLALNNKIENGSKNV